MCSELDWCLDWINMFFNIKYCSYGDLNLYNILLMILLFSCCLFRLDCILTNIFCLSGITKIDQSGDANLVTKLDEKHCNQLLEMEKEFSKSNHDSRHFIGSEIQFTQSSPAIVQSSIFQQNILFWRMVYSEYIYIFWTKTQCLLIRMATN